MEPGNRNGRCAARVLLAAVAVLPGCGEPARDPGTARTILVDNLHSPKRAQDFGMGWNDYRYSAVHGQKRLFDFLAENGYSRRHLTASESPRLTAAVLRDTGILLVDMIAQNCRDFAPDEVEAVVEWVARGGSLLVIVDHTNVYDNARRCNAILEPLGVRTLYSTAVERPPARLLDDDFWVVVRSFADHPVTRGVQAIFSATGAPFITTHGVAFLSEHGFADSWIDSGDDSSRLGNGRHDPGEEEGALPVIAAGSHGEGRFAVIGDENMLGNSRLFLGNNFELLANTFEWLARAEAQDPPLRGRLVASLRVAFDLEHSNWNTAASACDAYLPFYIDFNRGSGVVARGCPALAGNWDVLVFTDPAIPLDAGELEFVRSHLQAGGTVILTTDVVRARAGSCALLQALLPEVRITGAVTFPLGRLPAGPDLVATIHGAEEFPLSSPVLGVTAFRAAGHEYPPGTRCSYDIDASRPYLRAITATGGEPYLQARAGGRLVDLARVYRIGAGRLVVFFQDGLFRNETLGWERLQAGPHNEDAHRVVFEMIGWLKSIHRGVAPGSLAR